MIRRTIREWKRISYGTDETSIPRLLADRLAAQARASVFSGRGGEGVLEHGRKGLRARGVVGVIATPGCQLEILPKIEGAGESGVDNATLRDRLIDMLAVAWDIRVDTRGIAQLGWQRDTLLELLIRLYCDKLVDAVRQGIPQQYTDHEDDLPTLRGRLDVTRQFSTLAVSPQKLACRFDARSPDTALNQVMRATVGRLSRVAQIPENQRLLRELSFAYADITEVSPNALRWDLIVLDRTNTRWRELVAMARLFLGERYQQTSAGSMDGYALLFEMNVLFEQYVARILTRALQGTGLRVSAQGGHRDCLFQGDRGRFRTRPDLIVRRVGEVALIVDTKWKRIKHIEDPKKGVSQADVYQLMAYGQLYECPDVMLLYPHHGELPPDPILERYSIAKPGAQESLLVATLDVTRPRRKHEAVLRDLIFDCLDAAAAA
ncbi:MAG: restriction endonuclease [Gammaproteobacteria bacterium]|nr:restriction endonuclease [Gammaproteobacteria bacterium]MDE0443606.1 restriction endonuclease [Gammaproteobacteria bacterium]